MIKKMMLLTLAGLSMAAIGAKPNDAAENMSLTAAVHDRTMVKEAQVSNIPLLTSSDDKRAGTTISPFQANGEDSLIINSSTLRNALTMDVQNQLNNYGYIGLGINIPKEYVVQILNVLTNGKFDTNIKYILDFGLGAPAGVVCFSKNDWHGVDAFLDMFSCTSGDATVNSEGIGSLASHLQLTFYVYNAKGQLQDGQTADVYINVDDSLTIDQILANVSAEDLLGESVQVQCSEDEKAKYHSDQIGTYKITITATDKYGQTATCYLNIHVTDTVGPEITNPKALNFAVGDTLVFADITDYITITDNGTDHGGTIGTPTYKIDGQAFTSDKVWGASDVGNHNLEVSVADSSGNSTSKTFQITVRDTIAPVITMKDGSEGKLLIGLSRVLNFSEEEFLALFTATDNVTPTSDIVIDVEGDFIPSKVGEYDIKVVATDKAGNKGSYTCHVVVDADLPPVFILSDALIGATAETPLSSSQLQQIVANGLYADKEVLSVKLDDADYQANATKKGSYPVAYSVSYKAADGSVEEEDGTMTIRVDNSADEEQPEEEKSAWQKFCDWWTNGWQCFCNWFRGVFTKGEWDCWITNEEWDKRFPEEAEVEDSTSESSDPQTSPIED